MERSLSSVRSTQGHGDPQHLAPAHAFGEVKVYEALRDHPATEGWLVWHGLPIRHHDTQVEGEADFVIMVPGEGMLVIEVKSHERITVDDEGWRLGNAEPTARSPYDEAWDNSRSIRTWIQRKAFVPGYPIWQAAWFPNIGGELTKRIEQRIDVPENATLTRADIDPSRMVTSIIAILRHGVRELERRSLCHVVHRRSVRAVGPGTLPSRPARRHRHPGVHRR